MKKPDNLKIGSMFPFQLHGGLIDGTREMFILQGYYKPSEAKAILRWMIKAEKWLNEKTPKARKK